MFIATITVQSSVFKEEPSEEVNLLIREHGLQDEIVFEATWEKGCVLEYFSLFAANADAWISLATAAAGYKVLKEYKDLREGALLITKDLMGFSKTIAGIPVKIVRSVYLVVNYLVGKVKQCLICIIHQRKRNAVEKIRANNV